MSDYSFSLTPLIWLGAIIMGCIWGAWALIDWVFISEDIRSDKPLKPRIELVIRDNKVDTVYVYSHNDGE